MTRPGDWLATYTGCRIWPLDPQPDEIHIDDIAHALSNICRFGGHSSEFYSVAQHSVLVSDYGLPEFRLWGLLHDAAEAFIGDVVRPLKRLDELAPLRRAEDRIMLCIAAKFGLELPAQRGHIVPAPVKIIDGRVLATEARQLMRGSLTDWNLEEEPLSFVINPLPPKAAERLFLQRFDELTAARVPVAVSGVRGRR